ncbi:MAG: FAD-dependent oxidoreductase, partial [Nocardioidaceae bacterium]
RPDPDVAELVLERAIELVPELAQAGVLGHKVGLRPVRPEVRLEAEQRDGTRVVHCYGHGGAGVTLSWGCADEVTGLVGAAG